MLARLLLVLGKGCILRANRYINPKQFSIPTNNGRVRDLIQHGNTSAKITGIRARSHGFTRWCSARRREDGGCAMQMPPPLPPTPGGYSAEKVEITTAAAATGAACGGGQEKK